MFLVCCFQEQLQELQEQQKRVNGEFSAAQQENRRLTEGLHEEQLKLTELQRREEEQQRREEEQQQEQDSMKVPDHEASSSSPSIRVDRQEPELKLSSRRRRRGRRRSSRRRIFFFSVSDLFFHFHIFFSVSHLFSQFHIFFSVSDFWP